MCNGTGECDGAPCRECYGAHPLVRMIREAINDVTYNWGVYYTIDQHLLCDWAITESEKPQALIKPFLTSPNELAAILNAAFGNDEELGAEVGTAIYIVCEDMGEDLPSDAWFYTMDVELNGYVAQGWG